MLNPQLTVINPVARRNLLTPLFIFVLLHLSDFDTAFMIVRSPYGLENWLDREIS